MMIGSSTRRQNSFGFRHLSSTGSPFLPDLTNRFHTITGLNRKNDQCVITFTKSYDIYDGCIRFGLGEDRHFKATTISDSKQAGQWLEMAVEFIAQLGIC
jgi:hypothetical protein